MPQTMPYSKLQNRQVTIVTTKGKRSRSIKRIYIFNTLLGIGLLHSLFDLHISEILSSSTRDIIAAMMSAASVVLGIK